MTVDTGEPQAPEQAGRNWSRGKALLVVLLLAVGFVLGTVWQRHEDVGSGVAREVSGVATWQGDEESGYTLAFQGDDGSTISQDLNDLTWTWPERHTEGTGGTPPCMQRGRPFRTTVGVLNVETADTGGYLYLAWLRCH